MIKRRAFMILGSLWGLSTYLPAQTKSKLKKEFTQVEETIRSVQEHMFPEGSQLPSAKSMQATEFLYQTISHKSYDRDIRAFVIAGAKEFMEREEGKFTTMSTLQKEKALRDYEETSYGSSWLSRIMTLSMEAIFSDPIYGSNVNEAGWKAVKSYGGHPRPKIKYLGT